MLRILFLIFFLCGLTIFSVSLEYRATAETFECQPLRVCVPNVQPPDCEIPDCQVGFVPLRRSCERPWREPLIGTPIRYPQSLCFVDVPFDPLEMVARVSTLDILRAIGRQQR